MDYNTNVNHYIIMQTKLQELTEKIYREGVVKAEAEAAGILDKAREDAKQLMDRAKRDAETILSDAKNEAEETKRNGLNEFRLAARQMMSDVKQQIASLIENEVIAKPVSGVFNQDEFVRELILSVVKNWSPAEGESVQLEALLPQEKLKAMEEFLTVGAGKVLSEGVSLTGSDRLKSGFSIGPAEGGYRISFSDEDFTRFIKAYLRPKLMELLFDAENQG